MSRDAPVDAQLLGERMEPPEYPEVNPTAAQATQGDGERRSSPRGENGPHGVDGLGPHAANSSSPVGSGPADPLGTVLQLLSERHVIQSLLAAFLAWATTVAPAAFARGSPPVASGLAVLALLMAVTGPLIGARRRRLGRHIGISFFLALAVGTWLVASSAIQPSRLEPTRAAIGAVAWGIFALSWTDPWRFRRAAASSDPCAPALQARATLPAFAISVASIGVVAGLVCLALTWRIRDNGRALLGQSAALVCALALITVSGTVAIGRGKRYVSRPWRMTGSGARALILLVLFAATGAIVLVLR